MTEVPAPQAQGPAPDAVLHATTAAEYALSVLRFRMKQGKLKYDELGPGEADAVRNAVRDLMVAKKISSNEMSRRLGIDTHFNALLKPSRKPKVTTMADWLRAAMNEKGAKLPPQMRAYDVRRNAVVEVRERPSFHTDMFGPPKVAPPKPVWRPGQGSTVPMPTWEEMLARHVEPVRRPNG